MTWWAPRRTTSSLGAGAAGAVADPPGAAAPTAAGGATAGRLVLGGCAAVMGGTVWWLKPSGADLVVVLSAVAALLAAVLVCGRVPWSLMGPRSLLAVPAAAAGALSTVGLLTSVGPPFVPLVTLLFAYVGITQARWVPLRVLPAGMLTWLSLQGGPGTLTDPRLTVRLVIATSVWAVVGELLAHRASVLDARNRAAETQAGWDALTGLRNRYGLDARLTALGPGDCVALLDLDHFKRVNDTHGHATGDEVLRRFAAYVRTTMRRGDEAVRYGGEEVLVLASATDTDGAAALLGRLRADWARLGGPVSSTESLPGWTTFSAGVAAVTAAGGGHEALIHADAALYRAKAAGRDHTVVADPPVPAQSRGGRRDGHGGDRLLDRRPAAPSAFGHAARGGAE